MSKWSENDKYSDDITMEIFAEYYVFKGMNISNDEIGKAIPFEQYYYEDSLLKNGYNFQPEFSELKLNSFNKIKYDTLKRFIKDINFGKRSLQYKYQTIQPIKVFDSKSIIFWAIRYLIFVISILSLFIILTLVSRLIAIRGFKKICGWTLGTIVLFLIVTNPTLTDFKEYIGNTSIGVHNQCRKQSNYLIFSTYQEKKDGSSYIGLFKNF